MMIGKEFIYNKTRNKYRVLGESKMKNPVTREWEDCVIYQAMEGKGELEPMTFVRQKKEFLERFTEVNPNWINVYYGISGTLKRTTIEHALKYDPDGIPMWSEIKLWKGLENKLFPGLVNGDNLNFALLHLCNLQTIGIGKSYGHTFYIERGITDMLYFENLEKNNITPEIINCATDKESEYLGDNVKRVLIQMKDPEFIAQKILSEETRAEKFTGVEDYLKQQENYVEFTKKYNTIDQEIVIEDAKDYITGLGLEYV